MFPENQKIPEAQFPHPGRGNGAGYVCAITPRDTREGDQGGGALTYMGLLIKIGYNLVGLKTFIQDCFVTQNVSSDHLISGNSGINLLLL